MHTVTPPLAITGPRTPRRIALLGGCTLLAGLLLPLSTAIALWHQSSAEWLARALSMAPDLANTAPTLPWPVWAAVAVLAMAPVLLMGAAWIWAGLGLLRIAAAQALSLTLVRCLRRFAACTLAAAVLGTLCPTLIGLLLSGALGGPLRLSLGLDSRELVLLLFAAVTWQLAAVLDEATAIAAEHAQIV